MRDNEQVTIRAIARHEHGTLLILVGLMTGLVLVQIGILIWMTQQAHVWTADGVHRVQELEVNWDG